VATPPPDLKSRAPQLGAPLAALIMRLLAKSPADRPASAEAVIAELQPFLPSKRPSAAATAAMAATEMGTNPTPRLPLQPAAKAAPPPRARRLWLPIAVLVAVAGVGAVAVRARRHPGSPGADQGAEAARAHVALARTASLAGQDEVAEKELREALRLDPRSPVALFNLAVVLLERERPAEALPLLDVVLRDDPAHATAHLVRGQARLKTKDPRGASDDLEQQTKVAPQHAATWLLLAQARHELGDDEGARQAQARARQLPTGGAR
jgi:tetratricopeptide (TPR) repeat protein